MAPLPAAWIFAWRLGAAIFLTSVWFAVAFLAARSAMPELIRLATSMEVFRAYPEFIQFVADAGPVGVAVGLAAPVLRRAWRWAALKLPGRRPDGPLGVGGRADVGVDSLSAPPDEHAIRTSNLPPRNRNFVGRQAELVRIRTAFTPEDQAPVVALHGMGGVGKTQLAIEFAHKNELDFDIVWFVDAEQELLIGQQIAALAPRLGIRATGQIPTDASAVLNQLRLRKRWLVVLDNAEPSPALRRWIPPGDGKVLVTSRHRGWGGLAHPIEIGVLQRNEATTILIHRVPEIEPSTAVELAAEVGDLPLALEQAAAYLEATHTPPKTYLDRFRIKRDSVLTKGIDVAYGGTIATAWSLALERLREEAPATVRLLDLCAHLGPEPIPLSMFTNRPEVLGEPLAGMADKDLTADFNDIVGSAVALSFASRDENTFRLHVLVQAVIRANQPPVQRQDNARTVRSLLNAFRPCVPIEDIAGWPTWAQLAPHALTASALHPEDGASDIGDAARSLLLDTGWYLHSRGDPRSARLHISRLHIRWQRELGSDHPDTLAAAHRLAVCLWVLGDPYSAYRLDQDTLRRRQRVLGQNHPETLRTANNLGIDLRALGKIEAARSIHEDTLTRQRQILGPDHPYTLRTANNFADDLRMLGETETARTLHADTHARQRRLYGEENLETLSAANSLANDLRELGELEEARLLHEETLARQRLVLGMDHPHTLRTASSLARDLQLLGESKAAHSLAKDTFLRQTRVLGDDHRETRRTREYCQDEGP